MTSIICERTDCVHNKHTKGLYSSVEGECTAKSINLEDQMYGLLECHSYEERREGKEPPK